MDPKIEHHPIYSFVFLENIVTVKVLKSIRKINLLSSKTGPFKKGKMVKIKFWIAILLQQLNLCKIEKPKWFEEKWLEKKINLEKNSILLQTLPFNYVEISKIFSKNKNKIFFLKESSLVEEIFSIRSLKLWNGIKTIKGQISALKFDKICLVEFLNLKKIIQFFLFFLYHI